MLELLQKRMLSCLLLGTMITLLFIITIQNYLQMTEQFQSVSVRIKNEGVSLRQIQNAIENEKKKESTTTPEISAFSVKEHVKITEADFERNQYVTTYQVYGEMNQIFPMRLILGNYPYKEDVKGCVLDKKTAFALFGSYKVLGKKITSEDHDLYIRGIIDNNSPVLLYQTNQREVIFWNLELVFRGEENGRQLTEGFLLSHGLSNDYVIVEGNYIVKLLGNIIGLPIIILLLGFFRLRCKEGKAFINPIISPRKETSRPNEFTVNAVRKISIEFREKVLERKWKVLLWLVVIISTIILLFLSMRHFLYVPKRFIPTKWSDFTHWSKIVRTFQEHYKEIIALLPVKKDSELIQKVSFHVFLSTINIMLIGLLYIYQSGKHNDKEH